MRNNVKQNRLYAGIYYEAARLHEKDLVQSYRGLFCLCDKDCSHQLPADAEPFHSPMCWKKRQTVIAKINEALYNTLSTFRKSMISTDVWMTRKGSWISENPTCDYIEPRYLEKNECESYDSRYLKKDINSGQFLKRIIWHVVLLRKVLSLPDESFYGVTGQEITNCPNDYFALMLSDIESKILYLSQKHDKLKQLYDKSKHKRIDEEEMKQCKKIIGLYIQVERLLFTYKQQFNPQQSIFCIIFEFVSLRVEEIIPAINTNVDQISMIILACLVIRLQYLSIPYNNLFATTQRLVNAAIQRKERALQRVAALQKAILMGQVDEATQRELSRANDLLHREKFKQNICKVGCAAVGILCGLRIWDHVSKNQKNDS